MGTSPRSRRCDREKTSPRARPRRRARWPPSWGSASPVALRLPRRRGGRSPRPPRKPSAKTQAARQPSASTMPTMKGVVFAGTGRAAGRVGVGEDALARRGSTEERGARPSGLPSPRRGSRSGPTTRRRRRAAGGAAGSPRRPPARPPRRPGPHGIDRRQALTAAVGAQVEQHADVEDVGGQQGEPEDALGHQRGRRWLRWVHGSTGEGVRSGRGMATGARWGERLRPPRRSRCRGRWRAASPRAPRPAAGTTAATPPPPRAPSP